MANIESQIENKGYRIAEVVGENLLGGVLQEYRGNDRYSDVFAVRRDLLEGKLGSSFKYTYSIYVNSK